MSWHLLIAFFYMLVGSNNANEDISCVSHAKNREIMCIKQPGPAEELHLHNICNGDISFKAQGFVTNIDKYTCHEYDEEREIPSDTTFTYTYAHVGKGFKRELHIADCIWRSPGDLKIAMPCPACMRHVVVDKNTTHSDPGTDKMGNRRLKGRLEAIPLSVY
ncbi:uncharacterized protein LOC136027468 [Artemia franciscana]|uniref:uncharacterized protein LOC136027468 n=1 Tax=Artemia franciscana TaxID=6661 RepID=UPI0032D9EA5C